MVIFKVNCRIYETNQMNILATIKKLAIFIVTHIKVTYYDIAITTNKR